VGWCGVIPHSISRVSSKVENEAISGTRRRRFTATPSFSPIPPYLEYIDKVVQRVKADFQAQINQIVKEKARTLEKK